MFSKLKRFAVVAALCVLSACTSVTTITPAGGSTGAEPDKSLIGGWKVQLADAGTPTEAYVFLMPAKDAGLQAVAVGWADIPASSRTVADGEWYLADVRIGDNLVCLPAAVRGASTRIGFQLGGPSGAASVARSGVWPNASG